MLGEVVQKTGAHQHRRDRDPLVDLLVPVVDDAGFDQIGDPVADRAGMQAEPALAAEGARHRLRDLADAELDRGPVGNQARDMHRDRLFDRADRPRRHLQHRMRGRHQDVDQARLDQRVALGPGQ